MSEWTPEMSDEVRKAADIILQEGNPVRAFILHQMVGAIESQRAELEEWEEGAQDLWKMAQHGYSVAQQVLSLHDEILPIIQAIEDPYESIDEELQEMIEGYFSYAYRVAASYRKKFEAERDLQKKLAKDALRSQHATSGEGE